MDSPTPKNQPTLAQQIEMMEVVVRRRQLFAKAFDKETMRELERFLGVDLNIFAFRANKDGHVDPYLAAQQDALMGVVRGIKFEVNHLKQAEETLDALRAQQEKEAE